MMRADTVRDKAKKQVNSEGKTQSEFESVLHNVCKNFFI